MRKYTLFLHLAYLYLSLFLQYSYAFQDPTRPPADIQAKALSSSAFVLSAILKEGKLKLAVINGLYKKTGDVILGATITQINADTVQLEGPSGKITLFLLSQPVKSGEVIQCKREFDLCKDARL